MIKTKKKKTKIYFGKDVQDAIIEFNTNESLTQYDRDKLFREIINPAFDKLCENVINTWKFHNFETNYEDLKVETVCELYSKISGFNPEKGRAYSYFTIIARNYLIRYNISFLKTTQQIGTMEEVDLGRNLYSEIYRSDHQIILHEFCKEFVVYVRENIDYIFKTYRDKKIADSILELFEIVDDLDIFNKKVLYILIRDRTNIDTQYITKVAKVLKKIFKVMFITYRNEDILKYDLSEFGLLDIYINKKDAFYYDNEEE